MSKQRRPQPAAGPKQAQLGQSGPMAEPGHDNSFLQSMLGAGRGEAGSSPVSEGQSPQVAIAGDASELDSSAPAIDVQNEYQSPDGGGARTTVGIKEKSWLQAEDGSTGTWRSTAGSGQVTDQGVYEWVAPSTASTVTITFTGEGGATSTVTMTVVTPTSLTATSMTARSYGSGEQGAGMDLILALGPDTVSFGNLEWKEESGGPSNVQGYFAGKGGLDHTANPNWSSVGSDNTVTDLAEFHGWPSPWAAGSYTWAIPNKWRTDGGGAAHDLVTSSQVMTIADDTGASSVSKLGRSTSRTP